MTPEGIPENISRPDIATELREMREVDQAMRAKAHEDDGFWDYDIDRKNTARLKEIIQELGFPTISMVGEEGARIAWLLVQHADKDVEFQKESLNLMKNLSSDEVHRVDIAYLEDRIRMNLKQPQIYGTQFTQSNGKHVPLPIENEEKVNERRAAMGMDTLADQIARMYQKYPLMNFESLSPRDKAFAELFNQILQHSAEKTAGENTVPTIEYALPYPKEDFLKFLVENRGVLLHGSSAKDIAVFEPRQANDRSKVSGNKKAVYAVTDPVLPIFYAIQEREKIDGVIESGVDGPTEAGEMKYHFSLPKAALEQRPWGRGAVYLFDKAAFTAELDDSGELSGEWTSAVSVKPIAKLEVGVEDFRFLEQVEGAE